jgi:hypothetical protein
MDKMDFTQNLSVCEVLKAKVFNYEKLKAVRLLQNDSSKFNSHLNFLIHGDTLETKLINYILLIPLFINVECMLNNKKIMRRFRNSILEMKDSSNFHNYLKNHWIF